jgi:hypothetical protein
MLVSVVFLLVIKVCYLVRISWPMLFNLWLSFWLKLLDFKSWLIFKVDFVAALRVYDS